jgi:hypothetical protein
VPSNEMVPLAMLFLSMKIIWCHPFSLVVNWIFRC